MVQELLSLEFERGVSFGQIKLSGQIWSLRLLPMENWKSHEYKGPREFYRISNEG
jgi:hypothetical protein